MSRRINSSGDRPRGGAVLCPQRLAAIPLGPNLLGFILLLQAACTHQVAQTPTDIWVPLVVGADQRDARDTLSALGFVVETQAVDAPALEAQFGTNAKTWPPTDTVIEQSPHGGSLAAGATVVLRVARHDRQEIAPPAVAPAQIPQTSVPDVRALSLAGATHELQQAGLRMRAVVVNASELRARFGNLSGRWPAPESVIGQRPPGGVLEDMAAVVEVDVARWSPRELELGAVTGSTRANALRRLEMAGYRVDIKTRRPSGAPNAKRGDVLAARLSGRNNGQSVVQLTVASADGSNVAPPPARDTDSDGVSDTQDQCRQTPPGVVVDARGCEREPVIADADADGVPDDVDLCPDSPPGSLGAPQGCTLTQRVNRLPEGLYAFNRQTVMEVGRSEGYRIVLVLDPRGAATPSDVEAQVLSELPAGDRPPPRTVRIIRDDVDECAEPVVCFREKYFERMRVDLRVDQDDWVIRPDNPVDIRGVVSDQVTRWSWTVMPACDGGGLLNGQCRPAALTLDAYAMFDDTSYGPIMVFNEQITVEVSTDERVASFFERHRSLIVGSLIFAGLLAIAAWWVSRRRHRAAAPAAEFEAVSVLFIGANPRDTSRIRLDEEVRGIDQSIRLGQRRDAFTLHQHWAARVSDLDDALMRFRPNIVHISAHGTDRGELLLEGGEGSDGKVSAAQLEKLFAILSDDIRLVVLNACFSEEQARLVVNHVDCVVGMSDAVNDKVAQRFAESFYLALANGRSVQIAFELASAEVQGKNQDAVPRLLALRSDPNRIEFARRAPTRHIEGVST